MDARAPPTPPTPAEGRALWSSIWSFFTSARAASQTAPMPSFMPGMMSLHPTTQPLQGSEPYPWARSLQLALWDNVCGPRVVHIWEGPSPLQEFESASLAQQILKDEICRELDEGVLEPKFHVLPDLDSMVASIVFAGVYEGSVQRLALSLVLASSELDRALEVYPAVSTRMHHLVEKLIALLKRSPVAAMEAFSEFVPGFAAHVFALHEASLAQPSFAGSMFGSTHGAELDHTFVALCIATHIQNHGCTVVVGTDPAVVNTLVDTIALFIRPEERLRACRAPSAAGAAPTAAATTAAVTTAAAAVATAVEGEPATETSADTGGADTGAERRRSTYVPDLFLQGLVLEPEEGADSEQARAGAPSELPGWGVGLTDEAVIQSVLPTTVIDVDAAKVFQTHSYNEYAVLREEYMESELALLFGMDSDNRWSASDGLFRPVKEVSALIEEFVIDVLRLPLRLRHARITEGLRILTRRALLLIQCIEAELDATGSLSKDSVKKLRSDLGLTTKSDLDVLLGVAERFRPGSYKDVLGDPAFVEDQLKLLLESFL